MLPTTPNDQPQELTEKPPPTLPEDADFSPEFRNLLAKMLVADPANR